MRWSKLKQLIEARFAAEIQGRVQIHTTRYHSAHDQEGEIYITSQSRQPQHPIIALDRFAPTAAFS